MSAAVPKGIGTRLVQGTVLAVLFGMVYAARRLVPESEGPVGVIAAVGFLLLAGTLMSELLEPIGMPHLTGYLLAGILAGPHVLQLVDHEAVVSLNSVNALALALIALAGGAELRVSELRAGLKSLAWTTLVQHTFVLLVMTAVFASARPLIPFARHMPLAGLLGASLLWGAMAVTRSPSATLGILSQTRATGPLAAHTLRSVMTSDVVVVVLLAVIMMIARPLIEPGAPFSLRELRTLGYELLGSVSLGTTLGLVLAVYLRLIGTQLIVVLIALGFGMTEVMHYLRLEPLLGFMVAGFVVQNLSNQGEKFLHGIERAGGVVYVLFFATAGAHLDVPILRALWPVALLLTFGRGLATWVAGRMASRLAGDPPVLRRWGWSGLISQAGLALGLAMLVGRTFPSIGAEFRALAIAAVALNEMIGPVLFKMALDRSGETSAQGPELRVSHPAGATPEAVALAHARVPPPPKVPRIERDATAE